MMFGVEGTLFPPPLFPFSIVLIAIYLSHPYTPLLFIFHIFLLFPLFLFFPYISTWLYYVKTKLIKIAYARRNKKTNKITKNYVH